MNALSEKIEALEAEVKKIKEKVGMKEEKPKSEAATEKPKTHG